MARSKKAVEGVQQILSAAKQITKRLEAGVARGLKIGGLFLQRKSMEIVPVDQGNLRASSFTRASGRGFNTEVRVGYTAEYAVYVHENLDAAHGAEYNAKYGEGLRGNNQQAKFLEQPARQYAAQIGDLVREEAKV